MVTFLEDDMIDDEDKEKAFLIAAQNGRVEIVRLLLEDGEIDLGFQEAYTGMSALMYAAENGYIEVVNVILQHDEFQNEMLVDMRNSFGKTAYDIASSYGHNDICDILSPRVEKKTTSFSSIKERLLEDPKYKYKDVKYSDTDDDLLDFSLSEESDLDEETDSDSVELSLEEKNDSNDSEDSEDVDLWLKH